MQNNKGQTLIEYVVLIGVVVVFLVAMNQLIKRGVQSVLKTTSDQIAVQEEAEQSQDVRLGYLDHSHTTAKVDVMRDVQEQHYSTKYSFDETMSTNTETHSNLGFTKEN